MEFFKSFRERIHKLAFDNFEEAALEIFRFQFKNNFVYHEYCNNLDRGPYNVESIEEIPFLPIEFFKNTKVVSGKWQPQIVYKSSGTTGENQSLHYLDNEKFYLQNCKIGFEKRFGSLNNYIFLALLPSYMERDGSSLISMMNHFIDESEQLESGFYLNNLEELGQTIHLAKNAQKKVVLVGVTFALLDMAEKFPQDLSGVMVMETGGMKGRGKELTKEELYKLLKSEFSIDQIYSEYGMTELLSQAYSVNGQFECPPWMKILIREFNDPFSYTSPGKSGGINVMDLANVHSCSFIETKDIGILRPKGTFEVLGRFDNSDIRGCNLLVQ